MREDEQAVRNSLNCLHGDLNAQSPPPRQREEGQTRMMSASPFRATLKVDKSHIMNTAESDDEFERQELPELQRSHMSAIKDDSEVLRQHRN